MVHRMMSVCGRFPNISDLAKLGRGWSESHLNLVSAMDIVKRSLLGLQKLLDIILARTVKRIL